LKTLPALLLKGIELMINSPLGFNIGRGRIDVNGGPIK
jgi:hypothetical protein